jgi:hypothetical protein
VDVPVDRSQRQLERAATVFAVAVLLHNSDHVRRGAGAIHGDVFVAGTLAIALEVAVVAAIFVRHRSAPLVAVSAGFSLAAGYVLVHFTPARSWLSDSLLSWSMTVSVVAAGFEAVSALALGMAGLRIVRERGLAAMSTRGETTLYRGGLRHPTVIAIALGNAVLLVVSFVQFAR